MEGDNLNCSIANGMIGFARLMLNSISRFTCPELSERGERMTTIMLETSIPSTIASLHEQPGRMSRGATQQLNPRSSKDLQSSSAITLSLTE